MRISLDWLKTYVAIPAPEELARRLTMGGLEVEAIEQPGAALKGVVTARIADSKPHPNADKLSVTSIDVGSGTPLQVVCGAKNYQVGDVVPLATVGTTLPGGLTIKAAQLRGVDSFGMLCSSKELGLSAEASGLLILPKDTTLGLPIAQALGLDDVVFEVNVTPNRADALCHLGVARDVAALTGTKVTVPSAKLAESSTAASSKIAIRIEDAERCPRYAARVVEGVKVGPSPQWLVRRLEACGVRAINAVVDVTNYVMLETGQPLHAFDLDQIAQGQIVVRTAKAGEALVTLDGKKRELTADELLICDAQKPLVLAGVMGGQSSEVTDKTTRLLLECASFQPATVRRAAKRHALHSESSHRFERGTDVHGIPAVLERAAALIAELSGGVVLQGVVDAWPKPSQRREVVLRPGRVGELLGVEVPRAESRQRLEALGFVHLGEASGADRYQVPGPRVDVSIEEDLVEEIARTRGFDTVPLALPQGLGKLEPLPAATRVEQRLRQALAGAGLSEVVNYSFVAPAHLKAFSADAGAIAIGNPLSAEQSVMRTTLLPSLVLNVVHNARHQGQAVRFYELARSYRPDPKGGLERRPAAQETLELAGVLWGARDGERTWTAKDAACDFYDAKAAVEAALAAVQVPGVRFEALESPWYHPRAAATVYSGSTKLGTLGELHPKAARRLEAPAGVFLFQLEVEQVVSVARLEPKAAPLGKFPTVFRDLAVVVPQSLANEAIRAVILEVGAPLVVDASVFDVYQGAPIPEGQKNVAYALRYRSPERTLTDEEVGAAHAKIVAQVNSRLGGSLRS
ncbi:MAG: phenylalanine--tRNA ligase subunit beta [Myxococcaceae bacterium]|nr:phenylalanine--tRNA ligase subunit beta [Myxococcaceae bacterium]